MICASCNRLYDNGTDRIHACEFDDLVARIKELNFELVAAERHHVTHHERENESNRRIAELESAICRHVRAREGESGERPDMTVSVLYRIEHQIKARDARTAQSNGPSQESK